MPAFDLVKDDPLVATYFFLEVDGDILTNLTSVQGLEMELEKSEYKQQTTTGKLVQQVQFSHPKMVGEMNVKRLAPLDSTNDPLWKWFLAIRTSGMSSTNRAGERKNGSIVIYDSTNTEIARWNFTNAWPQKIVTDPMEAGKSDAVSEVITFVFESLERVK